MDLYPNTRSGAFLFLNKTMEKASHINLQMTVSDAQADIKHALSKAKTITLNNSMEEILVAALQLQCTLDQMIIDLNTATISDMQRMVQQKKLTYTKLVQMYLTRIALYNDHTIKINAIRTLNSHALEMAAACDKLIREDPSRACGLFGIPVLLKDNINTQKKDGMPTTAGSIALAKNYPDEDAFLVKQLKAAGAIILGKTNLSEFANFITYGVKRADGTNSYMPSGYSTLAGQVLCPYKPGVINPSGSSSGSGVAAAAALAAITVGTETCGSILSPAEVNSLVGIKPTVGLISRSGVIPLSHSQDTAGPMGRNVSDAALLLTAMQGYDEKDSAMSQDSNHWVDFTKCLHMDALAGKRIGVYCIPNQETQPELYTALFQAIQQMEAKGATIVFSNMDPMQKKGLCTELAPLPDSKVLWFDFAIDIQNYLDSLTEHRISLADTEIRTLKDIIAFNQFYPERLIYGQSILEECAEYDITQGSADMEQAIQHRKSDLCASRTNGIDFLLERYQLDCLVCVNGGTTEIGAVAGYPSITVPTAYRSKKYDQEAINIQFTGKAFSEETLLSIAYSYEQATKVRKAPGMSQKEELKELVTDATSLQIDGTVYQHAVSILNDNFSNQRIVDEAAINLFQTICDIVNITPKQSF